GGTRLKQIIFLFYKTFFNNIYTRWWQHHEVMPVGGSWMHRNLHKPMCVFIAALLVNSVVFSTAMYPKLLHVSFRFFLFYSIGGSEFFLLAAMAYDRYVSICKPLKYPTLMGRTTIRVLLGLAWFVPALQLAVSVILSSERKLCKLTLNGIFCNNAIYSLHCVRSSIHSVIGVVCLVNIVLFPLLFILFTYTRILIISSRSSREVRQKAAQTCLPHLLVLISFSCLCSYDVVAVRLGSDFPKTVRLIMTLQVILYHPLFNPIIYGVKMKEISKHLRKLLCQGKVTS
uniref:G-protein coupled receptors family 1 profile domain-containing protein n=1 Tax=Amphiprion percula TaxID=161767 RepID=A0A3P8TN56_AMPPE